MSTTYQTARNQEPIIAKLRKLVALKERAGTEAEAANAADKIADLLAKHNLEMGVLENVDEQKGTEGTPDVQFTSVLQAYDIALASAVCEMMDTLFFIKTTFVRLKKVKAIVFVGLPANVEASKETFRYFQDSCLHMLDSRWRRGHVKGLNACRSYRIGISARILQICQAVKAARVARMKQPDQVEGQQCTALILVGNAVAKQYMDEVVKPNGVHRANYQVGSRDAYRMGFADGKEVDVHGTQKGKMLRRPM